MKQTCLKTSHDRHHSPTRQPTHPLTHHPPTFSHLLCICNGPAFNFFLMESTK